LNKHHLIASAKYARHLCLAALIAATSAICWITHPPTAESAPYDKPEVSFQAREDAYRDNNLGVAFLEQFDYRSAVDSFKRALSIDPQLGLAQTNLAIALYNLQDYENAAAAADTAARISPAAAQPFYILGLIARGRNNTEEAISNFNRVLRIDPDDVGANVNLGQIYMQQRQFDHAAASFRTAVRAEPYNSTALYNLATALLRSGGREEGQAFMARFQALRQSGAATSIGQNYFEQGRYAEAVTSTGMESGLVDAADPKVVFEESGLDTQTPVRNKRPRNSDSDAVALFDLDNDGDLDIVQFSGASARLYRNDSGVYVDISDSSGDLPKLFNGRVNGVAAGDYDNDGHIDLLIFGTGPIRLLRGDGKGVFRNASAAAKLPRSPLPAASGAFLDADHDGDLDIFLGGIGSGASSIKSSKTAAANTLLRNNGDGTFIDISAKAKINSPARAVAVVPTDFDNRRDIDVLVLNAGGRPQLWQNTRDGAFRDVAGQVGLNTTGSWTAAAVGDLDKDSFVDFFFGRRGGAGVFAMSDGRGKFKLADAPRGTENASAAQFLDYDNDGLLDLVLVTDKGLAVFRNLGDRWSETTRVAFKLGSPAASGLSHLASGDIDGDGDVDLAVALRGRVHLFVNVGGEANNSETVDLTGRVSNRAGVGAKIDIRAGSLTQKLESYAASPMPAPSSIHFGLGKRTRPDAVRIIWPSGIIQAETELDTLTAGRRSLRVEELDRKPSSCPYLYTWNGDKFQFITDFMGGGEMGDWQGEGVYDHPDPDEFVRIPPGALKPINDSYEIRVTNELEEVMFVDQLKLVAIEHDAGTEVYPNEGLAIPTSVKQLLYTTRGEHPPLSATDSSGENVLPQLEELDRKFYNSFKHTAIRGYAEPHVLTLTLDGKKGYNGRTLLLLTGWTDYAFSSDNVAASQSGKSHSFPKLQVRDSRGRWQTVIASIGIAVGRPQTVVVDLTGKFLRPSRDVRIVTNVKTYWDKAAVDTSAHSDVRKIELPPKRAELRERGFSAEKKFSEMIVPDYEKVVDDARWKYFSGKFTRTGDVLPLLGATDDIFVISKTGDELALTFDALPDPPTGKTYTFLLYADGYSKEMDINSASPEAVLPMPFKAMSKYPYGGNEHFPMTAEKQRIYDEYTTRVVRATFPRIESSFASQYRSR
jgi:cytochrome c-type biogenesis protein CcmH/NrfG